MKRQALKIESDYSDLIVEYVKQGLRSDNMLRVRLNPAMIFLKKIKPFSDDGAPILLFWWI
ncbi:hypothetical protein [Methanobrevibacter sp.]|uniref:hypothetical protein n=1 Tax=Methanobrevibacter sp. TaxID=66852 RepID=UPI00386AEE14